MCAGVEVIYSDKNMAGRGLFPAISAGGVCGILPSRDTESYLCGEYTEKECKPVKISEINGGVLAEF